MYLVKNTDDERVSRLTLLDWRVDGDHEEDLALIFMREQEKTNDGGVSKLEIMGSAVEVKKLVEKLDVVSSSRRETLNGRQRHEGVSLRFEHVGSRRNHSRHFRGRIAVLVRHRHVEATFHHSQRVGVFVLMKRQTQLILVARAVRNIPKRDLKRFLSIISSERELVLVDFCFSPVPAFYTERECKISKSTKTIKNTKK